MSDSKQGNFEFVEQKFLLILTHSIAVIEYISSIIVCLLILTVPLDLTVPLNTMKQESKTVR